MTEKHVIIEGALAGHTLGGSRQMIARSSIVGVDSKRTVPSVFGKGGAFTLNIHTVDGRHHQFTMVPPDAAQQIVELLS